jgi:CRISPR-associated protein Csd2
MTEPIKNRYEFVLFFDCENGNPNGDPDAGNMPRIDPESNYGIVTDVCLKRKIRNYAGMRGQDIFITEGEALGDKAKKLKTANAVCEKYYDVRTFGAVLTGLSKKEDKKGKGEPEEAGAKLDDAKVAANGGQVRGPAQLNFAKSVDPISPRDISITVVAKADKADEHNMGRKAIVPYALYRAEGYISANFAKKTGFSEEDLQLLWEALANMFEHDHSAARGKMASRKLVIFKHDSELGNAPAHKLFDLVSVNHVETPRAYSDYEIKVADNKFAGVKMETRDL